LTLSDGLPVMSASKRPVVRVERPVVRVERANERHRSVSVHRAGTLTT
jgi:hypothetical protein